MAAIFPALTKGGGQCFAFPNVCLTPAPPAPPIPVPYPSIGMVNQSKKTSGKVKFSGKEAVTVKSEIPRSTGDEAGLNKGVMSGMNMGKIKFITGSGTVKAQGQDCVYLSCMTAHNGSNANMPTGAQIAPSQTKVLLAP